MAKKIMNIAATVLVALVVILAVLLVGVRLFGYTPYAVLSPSMVPTYHPGDLVYVHKADPEKINAGDVLTFVANEQLTVVTHRVDAVDRENRCFYTKGDANATRDAAPVIYENTLGTVSFSIPILGYVSMFLKKPVGKYIGIAIGIALLLLLFLPEIISLFRKKTEVPAAATEPTETENISVEK